MEKWYSRTRPFTAFGIAVVLVLLTLGTVAYTRFQTIRAAARDLTEDALPCVYLIGKLQTGTLLKFTLLTDHIHAEDAAERVRLVERIGAVDSEMLDVMARYERLIDSPRDRELFEALKSARQPYLDCYLRVLNLSREGKREDALQLIGTRLTPLRNRLFAAADDEVVWNQADADHAGQAIGAAVDWTSIGFLSCLIFAIGIHTVAHYAGKRLRAERTLRDKERLFHEVFQEAPFGMTVAGMDGRYLQVNSTLCRMLGYSEQELLKLSWIDVTHPGDLEDSLRRKEQLLADPGSCQEWEKRYLRRDGNVVRVRVRLSSVLRDSTIKSRAEGRAEGWANDRGGNRGGDRANDRGGECPYFVVHVEDITERKRTEEALQESEGRFDSIAEGCPSMMWVTDAEGNNLSINRAYREFCGTTLADVEGGKWRLVIHPDDAPEYIAAFERAIRDKAPFREEARVRRADGAWRWFGSYAAPRLSRGGVFLGHVGLSADITRRRQAEEELLAARQAAEDDARHHEFQHSLIRAILEVSLDGILVVNEENRIASHNQRFLDVWQISMPSQPRNLSDSGIDDAHILAEACRMVQNPEAFMQRIQELYSDPGATDQCEIELKDGRTLERYSTGLWGERGQYLGRAWFFRDTTVRKQAEQALQNSEAKFRQLAENIREVFWMMAPADYQVLYVSPAYEQVWGRTCESLYQDPRSWMEPIHPDDVEGAHSVFARQMLGEAVESEYRIRTPDGQEKWIRDRAFPILDQAGQLIRVAGLAEDITEQKHFHEELVQAREAADAASRAKSSFLAQMSHEIRTPMNGIIGMLQLLAESSLSPLQQRYSQVAQECGHSLLSIIDDILDLSKIEARKVAIEHIDFNLRRIVESSVEGLQVRAREKGLAFQIRMEADIPEFLRGDPRRLGQVLGNLVSNAVKFTPEGKVSLDVRLESRHDGHTTLRFAVADTGIGIQPQQAERLFSPFVQADSSTTRKFGGTGLGLAICRQLVELMGGKIGVDSLEGHGSTFWFTAAFDVSASNGPRPVAEETVTTTAALAASLSATPVNPAAGAACKGRILVADDQPANQIVMLALLDRLGYRSDAVGDGAEALEAWRQGKYDLILMDWHMPVMDGPESVRRIRESGRPWVPIIAVTASAMAGDREACLLAGADDYLAKPVDLHLLAETLTKWLAHQESGLQLSPAPLPKASDVVFDEAALLDRLLQDRKLASRVMNAFLRDFPSRLETLRRRLDETDAPAARLQAHAIQGSAATVSACGLYAIARQIEGAAKEGRLDCAGDLLPRADEEFHRFKRTVESIQWTQV